MSLTRRKTALTTVRHWALVCAILTGAQIAGGRTITIQSNADSGPGSLRAALASASNGDTINIETKTNIVLTSGELLVTKSVTIKAPGATAATIDGNGASRVFHLVPGIALTIDGLVITNGRASSDPFDFPANFGGGIYSDHATLTVRNCVISNNSASQGGGIYSNGEGPGSATLRVTDCTFSGNSAGLVGGAINNDGENGRAVLSITGSTLSNNIAGCDSGDFLKGGSGIFNDGSFSGSAIATVNRSMISDNGSSTCGDFNRFGGAISNVAFSGNASLTVTESTLMRNQANYGGGIFNYADVGSALLTISGSTIGPSNSASGGGGGIYNNTPALGPSSKVINSTITGNQSDLGRPIVLGGAIVNGGSLTLQNDTLSENAGIGIWNVGPMDIGSSIFKAPGGGRNFKDDFAAITSRGYNLSSDAAGGDGARGPGGVLNGPGDFRNLDPLLGLLQDNGGPTLTHALLPNSPAINAGDPSFAPSSFNPPLLYDQRGPGYPRINNGRIDIGAFEWMSGQKYAALDLKVKITDIGPELGASGSISSFIFNRSDTNQVLLPGIQALFKSRNGGETWSAMGPIDSDGVREVPRTVRQDPVNSQVVFLAGGSAFYRSTDFGDSWTRLSPLSGFNVIGNFALLPGTPNVILALVGTDADSVVWRSENGGTTFVRETNTGLPTDESDLTTNDLRFPQYSDIVTTPADPNTVYVALSSWYPPDYHPSAIYKSADGGRTFAPLSSSPPHPGHVFPHPTNRNVLFVDDQSDPLSPRIFRSLNGGVSFDAVLNLPTGKFINSVVFDARNPSTLYVAGAAGAFRSTNLGQSFQPLGLTAAQLAGADGVTGLSVDPTNSNLVYVNTDRGNFKSVDGGRTFRSISAGWKNALVYNIAFDTASNPNLYVALGGGNGVIRTQDRGKNYERIADPIDPTDYYWRVRSFAFSPTQPNAIFAGTLTQGLFRSLDSGKSWTQSSVDTGNVGFRRQNSEIVVDPQNGNNVYFATTNTSLDFADWFGFYRSTDGGTTFHLTLNAEVSTVAIDPVHPNVLYAGDRFGNTQNLLKSSDRGLTFSALSPLYEAYRIIVDPTNPNTVYVSDGATLLRSNNGGATLLPASIGLPQFFDVAIDPQNPNRLYAWTAGGLFMTKDQGASWILVEKDQIVKTSGFQGAMAVNPKNPNLIYLSGTSVVEIEIQGH